ncbi:MAG: hypothetical protein ACFFE5_11365 [Candidatus Thorarchaeota archaeon]
MTISERPRFSKEELNLINKSPQNHELANKKQTINNLKLEEEIKPKIDMIQKQRDEKRWRKSLGCYYLNPEKFRFCLKKINNKP